MKKNIIILIVIWILLIIGIIYINKNDSGPVLEQEEKSLYVKQDELSKFKEIDYADYYDENDLDIQTDSIDKKFQYIRISGLSNKKIEGEINEKLYDLALYFKNSGMSDCSVQLRLNAFNILSVSYIYYGDNHISRSLNINLVNGEEISFTDIINTKNITSSLSRAYYDYASLLLNKINLSYKRKLDYYDSCISYGHDNCYNIFNSTTKEDVQEFVSSYQNIIDNMEDEALIFARNFNVNDDLNFYITSAGVVIDDVLVHGFSDYTFKLILYTKNNSKLFNYYYKYIGDNIFDDTIVGRKNILLSDYNSVSFNVDKTLIIDDYAIVRFDRYSATNEDDLNFFEVKKNSYDKDLFTFVYDIYESYSNENKYLLSYIECKMTKEVYDNEFKYAFSNKIMSDKYYVQDSNNYSCTNKYVLPTNYDIEFERVQIDDTYSSYYKISGVKNADFINADIEETVNNLINDGYVSISVSFINLDDYGCDLKIYAYKNESSASSQFNLKYEFE